MSNKKILTELKKQQKELIEQYNFGHKIILEEREIISSYINIPRRQLEHYKILNISLNEIVDDLSKVTKQIEEIETTITNQN